MEQYTFRVPVELDAKGRRGPPQAFKDVIAAQGGSITGLVADEGATLVYTVLASDPAPLLAIEGVELIEG